MNENSFSSIIESSGSILVLLPTRPYFDQVAAGLSLYLVLRETKDVIVACPSPMLVEFNRLVGVNKVTTELGNKNLTIRFKNYKASDIEKVSYDIENGEFRLTVIPKSGLASPTNEQVALEYSGVAANTLILVGGANASHFPLLAEKGFEGSKIVHVGTRALDLGSQHSVFSFDKPASSVSELVAGLIEQSAFKIDQDVATNLLMGIEDASSNFKGPDVTAETFEAVARLLRSGGQRLSKEGPEKENPPAGQAPGEEIPEKREETPKDWLEPKIYKGTSIS